MLVNDSNCFIGLSAFSSSVVYSIICLNFGVPAGFSDVACSEISKNCFFNDLSLPSCSSAGLSLIDGVTFEKSVSFWTVMWGLLSPELMPWLILLADFNRLRLLFDGDAYEGIMMPPDWMENVDFWDVCVLSILLVSGSLSFSRFRAGERPKLTTTTFIGPSVD